jgi:hypothetical protein
VAGLPSLSLHQSFTAYSSPLQYPVDEPLQTLMEKLVTKLDVLASGFLNWQSKKLGGKALGNMLDIGFSGEIQVALHSGNLCYAMDCVGAEISRCSAEVAN